MGEKVGADELRRVQNDLKKVPRMGEIEEIKERLKGKMSLGEKKEIVGKIREVGERMEREYLKTVQQIDYVGGEFQGAKAGLSQCIQKLAEKANREAVNSNSAAILKLQAFAPQSLEKKVYQKLKESKGNMPNPK